MKIYDSMKPIVRSIDIPKLYNTCILEAYKDGELVWREEHHNTTTDFPKNVINKGNFFDSIPNNKLFPLDKFFAGIQLISKQGDATRMTIPSDAEIYACAGDASMNVDNNDLRRGIYNVDSSEPLYGENGRIIGYKRVWNWLDTRGNCPDNLHPFKAVCLTRPDLAIGRYSTDELPPDAPLGEHFNKLAVTETLANCQLIDYENETAYAVSVSGTTLTVKSYQLDTKQYHICGVYNNSGVMDITRELTSEDYTLTASASNATTSVSLVGNIIHVLTWSGTTVTDYAIDTTDWSESHTSYTFDLGLNVSILRGSGNTLKKDLILYDGTDLWLMGSDWNIYKCDTTNPANVEQFTSPIQLNSNGCFAKLPNGDIIKLVYGSGGTDAPALYYRNGVLYATRSAFGAVDWGWYASAVNVTPYGTVLYSLPYSGRYNTEFYMQIGVAYGYVATVWNITDDDHYKTAGMDMRCIYIISEEEIT